MATPTKPALSLRIFIVENDPDTSKYLKLYLETRGHAVGKASTMKMALEKAGDFNCDVLISDIGLPDGNGWELLRSLHFSKPVYAIAMSGFGMTKDRVKSEEAGYRHHMLKPFRPQQLDALLDEAIHELRQ